MIRKVVKHGKATLTVSLPAKWCRKFGVREGDELEVNEKAREIVINISHNQKEPMRATIDFTSRKYSEKVIRWIITAVHKKGFDEIEIYYDSDLIHRIIQDKLKNLFLGWVIMNQKENYVLLKNINNEDEKEFKNLLRRAFLVSINMGQSLLDRIKNKNYDNITNLIDLEKTNNQLTNYCERILNRGYIAKDICFLYIIVWNIEKIPDEFRAICNYLSGRSNIEMNSSITMLFENILEYLEGYMKLFFNFSFNKLQELHAVKDKLNSEVQELYAMQMSYDDKILLSHLNMILNRISDFSASTIAINQADNQ
ncbi:MAG: hypothetical protein KKF44_11485 [Nanoarchaeota archaeon]|nr:hypothetical protein [Nanoarchaeota archaeon]